MLTIAEMKAEIESILTQIGAMRSQATSENRELSDDEESKMEARLNRVDELRRKIANEERLAATHTELEKGNKSPVKTDPDAGGGAGDTRGVTGYQTGSAIDRMPDPDAFPTLGDQLMAVVRHTRDGYTDPRLLRAASGLSEGTPSDGGWLVQQEFVTTILEKVYSVGELLQRVARTKIGAGKNGLKINAIDESSRVDGYRLGGVLAYWKCEAAEKTKSKPKFRQLQLDLNKLIALIYATDELMDDAVALESLIKKAMPQEIIFKLEDAIINGTGAGMPLGIMNCGSMIAQDRQTSDSITFLDVLNMWSRMWGPSRKKAIWLINQDIEPTLYRMCFTCGTYQSGPVYLPAGGVSGGMYSTLFGRPVIPSEYCETIGTAGKLKLAA